MIERRIDIAKDALGGLNYLFSSGLISSSFERERERLGFTLPPITASLTCHDKGTNGTRRALRTAIEEGQPYPRDNKLHFFFPRRPPRRAHFRDIASQEVVVRRPRRN